MDNNNLSQMFDIFWRDYISPTMRYVLHDVDKNFQQACNMRFAYENLEDYKKALFAIYQEKCLWLKELYMPDATVPVLDIYKHGAVLCRSILGCKPYSFNLKDAEEFVTQKFEGNARSQNTEWFFSNIYANYKVAFYASIGICYMNLLYKCEKEGNSKLRDRLQENPYLYFYPLANDIESFENSCMLGLQKNDVLGRSFDYFGYAIMLYQLEQYNCVCHFEKLDLD